jgi:hypothetical protein
VSERGEKKRAWGGGGVVIWPVGGGSVLKGSDGEGAPERWTPHGREFGIHDPHPHNMKHITGTEHHQHTTI